MKILALDTSARQFSIALWLDGQIVQELNSSPETASSRMLIPAIQGLVNAADWEWGTIDAIGLSGGPGSFSGLRIGATAATTLGYTLGRPLVAINTMEAIANRARDSSKYSPNKRIAVVMDAQRNELFLQEFRGQDSNCVESISVRRIVDKGSIRQELHHALVTGPGSALLIAQSSDSTGIDFVEPELWASAARSVAQLAAIQLAGGNAVDCWSLQLDYGRPSAAEEKIARTAAKSP